MAIDPDKLRHFWSSPDTLATPLLTLFLDAYGQVEEGEESKVIKALHWDPETIVSEIESDFKVSFPPINLDKLMASILIVTTDRFFHPLDDFIRVCNVFSGGRFDPRVFAPADAVGCAWGLTEALLLDPPEDDNHEPFSEEIRAYIGKAIEEEGLIDPPDILKIALM